MYKLRRIWLALGWLWVATITYLSLTPHPPEPMHFSNADKLEHALAYSFLMLWFCQVYQQRAPRIFIAGMLVALGVGIEYLQRMTAYRVFDYADMLANGTGVLLSLIFINMGLGRIGITLETKIFKTVK
ncbi:VanZ like family protein [Candidatus Nitrotoga sp. HW29]|uniref:VanZ family protein n=1 Tax=Candidatus Nitrotoga sp. HW29 TaxID=2886963 RepID=UPI001EF2073B|nr:VanZ family protein [Candidatus Nitrotoga sp. HW29]CAH1906170.1 VanZ like family protein [Candidatus Nitrotoga sp. HW29]